MQQNRDAEKEDTFYSHDHFNDDNLYKNRLHEAQPVKKESEFEKGLKLWERRSEGGIIPQSGHTERKMPSDREDYKEREIEEEKRMEMVRNRRSQYEQKRSGDNESGRYGDHGHSHRKDNSIERRLRDEGLQDG